MFPGGSLFGGLSGGLTGGTAGPSQSGEAKSGISGQHGISSPVVIGGFKSDGSAAGGGASVVPAWFAPAALLTAVVLAVALLRR